MCGRCGTSSMTSTVAFPGLALGGYHGDRQPSSTTRSASTARAAKSPPACIGLPRGKLELTADCGSTTGSARRSASSTRAANAAGSRPAVSTASTGRRAADSSRTASSTSSGTATVLPPTATGTGEVAAGRQGASSTSTGVFT